MEPLNHEGIVKKAPPVGCHGSPGDANVVVFGARDTRFIEGKGKSR